MIYYRGINLMNKMDKQEQFITNKDLRMAYIYTIIFLFVWIVIDLINGRSSLVLFLLVTQNLILIGDRYFYQRK